MNESEEEGCSPRKSRRLGDGETEPRLREIASDSDDNRNEDNGKKNLSNV